MNEELTNEVLEAMAKCRNDCPSCGAHEVCSKHGWQDTLQGLAAALLEERAKPKAWDGAPEDAFQAQITWFTKNGGFTGIKTYHRELPKTRADEIADEAAKLLPFACVNGNCNYVRDTIKSALNKYAEELEENHERRTDK